jgi:hypothetical protein
MGAAAQAVGGGALDAGRAAIGSFGILPGARPFAGGMARAAQAAMSSPPVQLAGRFGRGVGGSMANAGHSAAQDVRALVQHTVRGRARGVNPFGSSNPASSTVQLAAGQSWKLPGTTPPSGLASRAAALRQGGGPGRWMQRGADLYNQTRHEAKRDNQRDWVDFNKNLAAGAEGLRRFDPKALAHFGKAAGVGLKMLAGILSGPVGIIAAFVSFPKMVHGVTASLIENNRALGGVNATYARTMIQHDREQRLRQHSFAGGTASYFRDMVKAQNKLEKELQPYAIAGTIVLQKLLTIVTKMAVVQLEMVKKMPGVGPAVKAFEDEAKAREKGAQLDVEILLMNLKTLGGERNGRNIPPIPGR